jgi:hypothetical protein
MVATGEYERLQVRSCPITRVAHPLAASFAALALSACTGDSSPASCASLENTAAAALEIFESVEKGFLACQVDTDCVTTFVNQDGMCSAQCGGFTSKAGAAAFTIAAASVCQEFNARGCPLTVLACIVPPDSVICAAGTCTLYDVYPFLLSPPLTHGACAAFDAVYSAGAASPFNASNAPHDIAVTLSVCDGTLYADQACTTPLGTSTASSATGTVTIPSGSPSAGFGFEPQAAGPCVIETGQTSVFFVAQ